MATFSTITHSGISLSDYTEDSIFIGANADSLIGYEVFNGANGSDPYFYCLDGGSMGGGADAWVTIYTTDSKPIYAIEFLYGNSWTNGHGWGNDNAWVVWQTLRNGTVVSSGQVGPNPMLPVGTIMGFYDPSGFDTIQLKCNVQNQFDPNVQALAMDNLHLQLYGNVSETLAPVATTVQFGKVTGGDNASLSADDGNPLIVQKFFVPSSQAPIIRFTSSFVTTIQTPVQIEIDLKAKMVNAGSFRVRALMFDFAANSYVQALADSTLGLSYQTYIASVPGMAVDYVGLGNSLQARVEVQQTGPSTAVQPATSLEFLNLTVLG